MEKNKETEETTNESFSYTQQYSETNERKEVGIRVMFVLDNGLFREYEDLKKKAVAYFRNGTFDFSHGLLANSPKLEELKNYDIIVFGASGHCPTNRIKLGDDLSYLLENTNTGIISMMWQNDSSGKSNCDLLGKWKTGNYNPVNTRFNKTLLCPLEGLSFKDEEIQGIMGSPETHSKNAYVFTNTDLNESRKSRIIANWMNTKFFAIAELCDLKYIQLNFCPYNPNYGTWENSEELIFGSIKYLHERGNKKQMCSFSSIQGKM